MNTREVIPVAVMVYLLLTGLFFLIGSTIGTPFLTLDAPGKHYLTVISILFILFAVYFFVMWQRGRLRQEEITIVDIRKETIEKMKDSTFLAKVASDQNEYPEVREKAAERLEEIRA